MRNSASRHDSRFAEVSNVIAKAKQITRANGEQNVDVLSRSRTSTCSRSSHRIQIGASLGNLSDVHRSHLVRAVARSNNALPQPQKTLAAFPSGDCCLGHPKLKLFALERSSNVPHATNIAQFTQTHAGYLCYAFISCVRRLQHLLA